MSRIRPFCGRILLDQRLRINDLAVAAGGENAAKLLNLTVPEAERRRHVGPRLLERSQRFRGIADEHGRLMVVMSHSTDIADGGEREVEDYEFFRLFSMDSYAMAIDVLLYAMLP